MKFKYSWLPIALLWLTACDINNELEAIPEVEAPVVQVDATGLDLSNYVAVGASFSAGFTDNALFIAAQENSFPNIISKKFQLAGGGDFVQPLMNDNVGGLLFGGTMIQGPRLFFNGSGPASLATLGAVPTTEVTTKLPSNLNNYGIPGAKSYHFVAAGYGSVNAVPLGQANPYFARISSSETATVLGDAVANAPTFFTLSEIGGNDVLGYALGGGAGVDQTGNPNAGSYGSADITDPGLFKQIFDGMVETLTSNGAKGVVGNIPYITSLAHFTTVPYNPLDPTTNAELAGQIPLLNNVFGAINQIYAGAGQPERSIVFSTDGPNAMVIYDEDATDLSAAITATLGASPTFVPFVQSLGLPAAAAPLVAQLLGQQYGKARSATENDLFVLTSSAVIGTVDTDAAAALVAQSGGLLPATLAGQFSANGITLPLADKWVLTPQEQNNIKVATDAYNVTIKAAADSKGLAFVDFNAILQEAATSGLNFGDFTMTTNLVTGGLVSLDGVHLTARGYGLMANEFLKATDATYGSNFTLATDGLANPNDLPTNYSPMLR
ncbi:G-D-S-L family lipolytic protein [Tenacibaculum sp. MEBiC06402]|uniref:G-D-S-L family lipolytic protein n=1 Tax=unclassified Tenacibaculum TaxID=2635139 RepID=UPI003B9C95EC